MRVAVFGHSWVADRQAIFGQALRHELQVRGDSMVEYYPATWGPHRRVGGLPIDGAPDHMQWSFAMDAIRHIRRDDWDVALIQQEPYCRATSHIAALCVERHAPYALFTWDNLNPPQGAAKGIVAHAAHVVCGNTDAQTLVHEAEPNVATTILPQVGLDPDLFAPPTTDGVDKPYDILFAGRQDPMKGEADLATAAASESWRIARGHQLGHLPYANMWERYASAKIQCTPSKDVHGLPREQFAPYATLEGLLCGVPAVTTNQPAIYEWTRDLPGVWHAAQGKPQVLRYWLDRALRLPDAELRRLGAQARTAVTARFSNDVVARQYADLLTTIAK